MADDPNAMLSVAQLYKSGRIVAAPRASCKASPSAALNARVFVVRRDITTLQVDAIVNAANESLLGGGGVDGAIHRAAGPRLKQECRTLNGCDTGDAKMTSAYGALECQKVIHAVGPVYSSRRTTGRDSNAELLAGCYRRALELAAEARLASIAFSAISTGVYGYPSGEAAAVACGEARRFLDEDDGESSLQEIVFCNFLDKDVAAYDETLP